MGSVIRRWTQMDADKRRVSVVQLVAAQTSSFERFTYIKKRDWAGPSCILKAGEACLAPTWHWWAKDFSPLHLISFGGITC